MRIGTITSLPDEDDNYSQFGRIHDDYGVGYTVDPGDLPEDVDVGDEYAYKLELWENDSGLGFSLEDP